MSALTTPPGAGSSPAVGKVISVRGAAVRASLPSAKPNDDLRVTVGSYIAISAPRGLLIGMITDVSASLAEANAAEAKGVTALIDLVGQIVDNGATPAEFRRGVREYPVIGDELRLLSPDALRLIYAPSGKRTVTVGVLTQNPSIPVTIDVDNLVAKHFAVLGTTGVGKSSGLAAIVDQVSGANPDLRFLILDIHNEYSRCFGDRAHAVGVESFRLPFWMFNFEELTDVLYGGRTGVAEEIDILAELIPIAKSAYLNYKSADRPGLKKRDPKTTGFTVDTPVPYLIQDLLSLIDERMGKLENRASRMAHHRLTLRIEAMLSDPRYAFIFNSANVGGDTMAALLGYLFQLEPNGKRVTVLKLASLPSEVMDVVVCVILRLAFDLGVWSDGAFPLLCVCEEAHRFAAADHTIGFAPTRRALSKIAKEGRKYQVCLGLVTQRPAELDATIISQCSTIFAMRMANEQDQKLLQSAVSDAGADLLAFVPSLATGEVVGFGEGMFLPARFSFQQRAAEKLPQSEIGESVFGDDAETTQEDAVRAAVERWRRATTNAPARKEQQAASGQETPRPAPTPPEETSPVAQMTETLALSLLEQGRQRILRR